MKRSLFVVVVFFCLVAASSGATSAINTANGGDTPTMGVVF